MDARGPGYARVVSRPLRVWIDMAAPPQVLFFRLAHRVLVPEAFPVQELHRFGARTHRVVRYAGVKEEVYLADFQPDESFPTEFGLPADRVTITMRPPARSALYHRFENTLFE